MTPQDCIIIPLTRGYSTIIDQIDSDLANLKLQAHITHKKIYARHTKESKGKTKNTYIHRVILSRKLGRDLLPKERVDHKDGDGLNNCRDNLRLATPNQNNQNKDIQSNNSIGYKGVQKNGYGYMARIKVNDKQLYLGTHATPELAAAAYDEAALKYFGEFALTNQMLKERGL